MIHLQVLKTILIIAESAKYEFAENINSVLRCLLSGNNFFLLLLKIFYELNSLSLIL